MNEKALIRKIKAAAAKPRGWPASGLLGIGDDAALWRPQPQYEVILTCDWFLEDTHFLRHQHPADSIGWKSLARAVSDIAAMGGVPVCFLLSLALPVSLSGRWLDEFLGGLRRAARRFACPLAGGDTTCREQVLIGTTVVGRIPRGEAVLRSGARPGDVLFVSGRLGEAELGLQLIRKLPLRKLSKNVATGPLVRKHLYPKPRLALGRWLAENRLASAMMDLSDGLSTDLPRLCAAGSVGATIDATRLPVVRLSENPRLRQLDAHQLALHGGDDYELLFAVPASRARQVPSSLHGLALTAIGQITKARAILLTHRAGRERPLPNKGWDPFR
jgi:thiamine-monophosphate kinase